MNDAYAAFLYPLLPRVMGRLGLSITLAATLMMVLSLASSLAQPVLGHLADRGGRRWLLVGGPVVSGVFLSLIGWPEGFPALVLLLAVGGLGSAAFHPPGASIAVRAEEGRGSGMRHAIFSFGGAAGYAAGPLIAVALVARFGIRGMWVAMLPILVLAVIVWPVVPRGRSVGAPSGGIGVREALGLVSGPVALVFGVSVASAFLQRLFLTMEPIIVSRAGGAEATGALVLSVYLGGQAIGTLAGGWLADRVDRRRLLATLCGLAFPLHLAAFILPVGGGAALGIAAIAGAVNQAVLPPVVVIALEAAPGRGALSSGIVMGLAWATGSIGVLGAGALADGIGALAAAAFLTPVILAGIPLALRPALRAYARPSGFAPVVETGAPGTGGPAPD